MDKIENVKQFFVEHKYLILVSVVGLLILVIGGYTLYRSLSFRNQKPMVLDELEKQVLDESQENEETENINCIVMVDVKGEVNTPGLYEMECNSRVMDAIDLAGGSTKSADTSVLNLGKKVSDEMVIIVYSKEQVQNFSETKELENQILTSCQSELEVKNDACITSDSINTNMNEIIGDTPVNSLISLNNASKEELMQLSGIGESKADLIILYREENGGFKSIEELKNVKGIGDSIFEKIKDNITL